MRQGTGAGGTGLLIATTWADGAGLPPLGSTVIDTPRTGRTRGEIALTRVARPLSSGAMTPALMAPSLVSSHV
jgi:hypothetical protein